MSLLWSYLSNKKNCVQKHALFSEFSPFYWNVLENAWNCEPGGEKYYGRNLSFQEVLDRIWFSREIFHLFENLFFCWKACGLVNKLSWKLFSQIIRLVFCEHQHVTHFSHCWASTKWASAGWKKKLKILPHIERAFKWATARYVNVNSRWVPAILFFGFHFSISVLNQQNI